MDNKHNSAYWIIGAVSIIALIAAVVVNIFIGNVGISMEEMLQFLSGNAELSELKHIIISSRLNMTLTALLTGAALSVAGLLLQTLFSNPLADPSVLGISSGANLGVAVCLLIIGATPTMVASAGLSRQLWIALSSLLGALPIILLLLYISTKISNKLVVLMVGLMTSFISSAVISVIEFFSMKESLYSFVIWGMGSFSSVPQSMIPFYFSVILLLLIACFLMIKPLNAILLGDEYAENIGVNVYRSRTLIILISSLLIAIVTAYCGPIGFIGLAIPHIVRFSLKKSDHRIVLPFSILWGGLFALLCLVISRIPGIDGALPVNVITSIIGAPILIWILFQPSVKNLR